jgi:hypothetical protein
MLQHALHMLQDVVVKQSPQQRHLQHQLSSAISAASDQFLLACVMFMCQAAAAATSPAAAVIIGVICSQ